MRDGEEAVLNRPARAVGWALRVLQGALIGLGAVLPGISGGVLCVVFGIYKPVMTVERCVNPLRNWRTPPAPAAAGHFGGGHRLFGRGQPAGLFPRGLPGPVGLPVCGPDRGMLPSLFREAGEQGRTRGSYLAMAAAFALVLGLLTGLDALSVTIAPSFGWYLFCGFCVALSIIAPGMSFSTLLMPLGLLHPLCGGSGPSGSVGAGFPAAWAAL